MYIFSIPDVVSKFEDLSLNIRVVNWGMLEAKKQHPEWFYDDFVIETVYGCPFFCVWNGNRFHDVKENFDETWVEEVAGMYSEYGIDYRLTFSNFLVKKKDLQDKNANKLALALSKHGGYVTLSTNLMAEHMKKYPGLKICWSTSTDYGKTTDEKIDKINKLSEKNLVVIPYEINNTPEIERLLHPENIEVIINERCIDYCPNRRMHWREVNETILTHGKVHGKGCLFLDEYNDGKQRRHNVTRSMLSSYSDKGINHFKLSGRNEAEHILHSYEEYFVLPEFVTQFRAFVKQFINDFDGMFCQ